MAIDTRLTIDDVKVKAAVERVLRALPLGADARPVFSTMGRIVHTGTRLRFREQKTPEGAPWKPSIRVQREGGQTLRLSGRLANSHTWKADHSSVEIGTNVIYARVQHLGGKAGRKTHRVTLPARPALGASDADKLELVEAMNDYLGKRWRG